MAQPAVAARISTRVAIPAEPLLAVSDLTVRFGARQVLAGVELSLRRGELLALAGENGAGKSTLVRCIVGDLAPTSGTVRVDGRTVGTAPAALRHPGVGVVWQTPAQCDNLDITSNLLLGTERRWVMRSEGRMRATAGDLLARLGIPITDTSRPMQSLSRSQRQLVAIARAVRDRPALLVLDEPTGTLGVSESVLVEQLIARLHRAGSTILLVSHDIEQIMRLADRVAVLRHGAVVAEVDPALAHPDDIAALVAGQQVDSSARRQLVRLQGLVDQLASSDASSGLPLILSALGAALGVDRLCVHLTDADTLRLVGSLGLPSRQAAALGELPIGPRGGPAGIAAQTGQPAVERDDPGGWSLTGAASPDPARIRSPYAVPIVGSSGVLGAITVFRPEPGAPQRDELDLVGLYAGYAAGAVERDRLLGQVTARNRVLETIRVALEALTGPSPLEAGLTMALAAVRAGMRADSVLLLDVDPAGDLRCRAGIGGDGAPQVARQLSPAGAGPAGDESAELPADLAGTVAAALRGAPRSAHAIGRAASGPGYRSVTFTAPGGTAMLLARWVARTDPPEDGGLLADAAQCLRLAFERQEAETARQEASALRRSQQLQRQFLSRLSHELRTPLTAIRGYASSLTQTDVTWDSSSQHRFVSRISAESDRLGRLVGDLLDFSAIESGVLRLHPDWCEVPLVLQAARGCLAPDALPRVELRCAADLPVVWADHDRLEQVFVNLMDNAVRHNPPDTRVLVEAAPYAVGVAVTVTDDGAGMPEGTVGIAVPPGHRGATSGSGLGLSITHGIVQAHGGRIVAEAAPRGTRLRVEIPEDPRTEGAGEPAT